MTRKPEIRSKKVENPYAPGEFINVPVNIRESALENMLSRKRIGQAQYMAGSKFRSLYESMHMMNMAVDPSNEPVDFGGRADAMSVSKLERGQELAKALEQLSSFERAVVTDIAGMGMSISQTARRYNPQPSKRYKLRIGKILRGALLTLAEHWGYAKISK